MILLAKAVLAVAVPLLVTLGMAGCSTEAGEAPAPTTTSRPPSGPPRELLPPPVNEGTLVPSPVSRLNPGVPIMVGTENSVSAWCTAGFLIDYPDPSHAGQRLSAFTTAAQCARGDSHAPVSIMRAEPAGHAAELAEVGQITYLAPGETLPAEPGSPWTIPISPLAVFSPGTPDWALPVDARVNGKMPTPALVQSASQVESRGATAMWTNSTGLVVTGHVLDRSSTPELQAIPHGIERVVIAVNDTTMPTTDWERGSAVTVELDGDSYALGIITGANAARHWVVVDLIAPFLANHDAHLATSG